MIFVEKNNICYIPMDANIFLSVSRDYGQKMKYSKEYSITDSFFIELDTFIFSNRDKWDFIALDMNNISSAPSRKFALFLVYLDKLVMYNINNNRIQSILKEDLPEAKWKENNIFPSSVINDISLQMEITTIGSNVKQMKQIEIVNSLANKSDKLYLLESSGLYSNYYINIKQLFLDVENFQFIIYSLASILAKNKEQMKIDALVTSSKNGAIIAYILSGILDIKEVHLIGVGPKYAMEIGDAIECIRPGKRYAYVYDFMCTGTESKIVSALINSKKAYMPYAIGIAKYRKHINYCPVSRIDQLVDTEMMKIKYNIVGEKDEKNEQ